jgi:hypothetical protein
MSKENKEKKPVWKKWWFWVVVVIIGLIGISSSNGNKDSNSQNVTNPTSSNQQTTTAPASSTETAKEKITISNSSAKNKGYGIWEVVGEAKNNDSTKHSGMLKATFYAKDGSIMGTAVGAVNDLESGSTKTFNLSSTDSVSGYANMKVEVDTLF